MCYTKNMLKRPKLTLVFGIILLTTACESIPTNVTFRTNPVPDVHDIVMRGQTLTSPQGNVVRFMLIGFRHEPGHTDAVLGWHVLRQTTAAVQLAFEGFTIAVGQRTISSVNTANTPDSDQVSINQAGSIRIRFPSLRKLAGTGPFDFIEKTPAGIAGLRLINCRITGGHTNE